MARIALAAVLAALLAGAAGAAERIAVFPDSHHLFHRLLADPRQAQTSLRYYRLAGRDTADVALGNSWGMARWSLPDGWELQWSVEGMGYSRFLLSGAVNEFQTIDFLVNLPVELRRGEVSGRLTLFHESSHLGDDYIRRTGDTGFRFSVEGVRALLSWEPGGLLRIYGGGGRLLHAIPEFGRGELQAGLELKTPDLGWILTHPCWIYLAQDLQSKERVRWNLDSRTELGFRVGFDGVLRSMRLFVGHSEGHSGFGQFFARRESLTDLGAAFDF